GLAAVNQLSTVFPLKYRLELRDAGTAVVVWKQGLQTNFHSRHAFFSADGKRLALPAALPSPRVLDAGTGKLIAELPARPCPVACFGPGGRSLLLQELTGEEGKATGEVVEWSVESRRPLRRLEGSCSRLTPFALGPELDLLAAGDREGWLHIWEYGTGKQRHRLRVTEGAEVHHVAFTPDRRRLAVR